MPRPAQLKLAYAEITAVSKAENVFSTALITVKLKSKLTCHLLSGSEGVSLDTRSTPQTLSPNSSHVYSPYASGSGATELPGAPVYLYLPMSLVTRKSRASASPVVSTPNLLQRS